MSAPNLTERQLSALKFIRDMIDGGMPPTFREIGQVIRVRSTNAVAGCVRALERTGCITRSPRAPRFIKLTATGRRLARRATTTSSDVADSHSSASAARIGSGLARIATATTPSLGRR